MATERIEETILRNLLYDEEYYRKVVPFVKAEYFIELHENRLIGELIYVGFFRLDVRISKLQNNFLAFRACEVSRVSKSLIEPYQGYGLQTQ